jgi:hypothetical protein
MQVIEFTKHLSQIILPESYRQLSLLKTIRDVKMWRRQHINAINSIKVLGEDLD